MKQKGGQVVSTTSQTTPTTNQTQPQPQTQPQTQTQDRCDCDVIHLETVAQVQANLPEEETLRKLADLFKVFGDPTRVRILRALAESELCVCDIAWLLDMTQSAISHQLRQLRQASLVKSRREGKIMYYSLADKHVELILNQGFEHIIE